MLAKGEPRAPAEPIGDVIDWTYSGNKLHPTQKPVTVLTPLIQAFCGLGGLVLDPFAGSGSSLVAALSIGRSYLGMEIDPATHEVASRRLRCYRDALLHRLAMGDDADAQAVGAVQGRPQQGAAGNRASDEGYRPGLARGRTREPSPFGAALGARHG